MSELGDESATPNARGRCSRKDVRKWGRAGGSARTRPHEEQRVVSTNKENVRSQTQVLHAKPTGRGLTVRVGDGVNQAVGDVRGEKP